MRPLTDSCPKPLLVVQGKPLMQWHLDSLASSGVENVLVNIAWLGEKFISYFGNQGKPHLPNIVFSNEGHDFGSALETAGGIARALPQLDEVFWVMAGDVFAPDFVFSQQTFDSFARSDMLAHIWLIANPAHNLRGDFGMEVQPDGTHLATNVEEGLRYTYSTIGLYKRAFFAEPICNLPAGNPQGIKAPLAPLLRKAMDLRRVSAEIYTGRWTDVGTPERLAELNRHTP